MSNVTLNIIGCGGTGINIARQTNVPDAPGYPKVTKVYFDTSDRNVKEADMKNTFLLAGMNGAGKNQATAFSAASTQIDDFLRAHRPGTMNVVVYGAAGGSGSILGPLMLREFSNRGIPAIGLVIGSTVSEKEASNTKKSLLSIQNIASKVAAHPITIRYFENTKEDNNALSCTGSRTQVDEKVSETITKIALLTSEQHEELDREDVCNWLYFNKAVDVNPQLLDLVITTNLESASSLKDQTISMACLLHDRSSEVPDLGQMYSAVGYFGQGIANNVSANGGPKLNMVFALTPALRQARINSLEEKEQRFRKTAEMANAMAAEEVAGANEDGFVF